MENNRNYFVAILLSVLVLVAWQFLYVSPKIERERVMRRIPDLSFQILEIVKEHGRATISEIHSITRANRNTIKLRLRELVADGYLLRQGEGKGTRYILGKSIF